MRLSCAQPSSLLLRRWCPRRRRAFLLSMQSSFRQVAQKVLPVVVEVNVSEVVKQKGPGFFPFDWFFGQPKEGDQGSERTFRQSALGSGIIVRKTGDSVFVLTNNHVVDNATEVSVRFSDQRVYKAKVVGKDPRKDIALVSFDTQDPVSVADLGDSDSLQVGDIVFAIGNPLGFESSLTMGIVSALGRRAPSGDQATYTDYIQTDAAINQGNSGGALVNIRGQVDRHEHLDRGAQRRQRRARIRHSHQQRAPGNRRLHRQGQGGIRVARRADRGHPGQRSLAGRSPGT